MVQTLHVGWRQKKWNQIPTKLFTDLSASGFSQFGRFILIFYDSFCLFEELGSHAHTFPLTCISIGAFQD